MARSEKWLGGEVDIYRTNTRIKEQVITAEFQGQPTTVEFFATDLAITTFALNILLRYPGTIVQPYGGAGLGFNMIDLEIKKTGVTETTWEPTVNVVAGIKIFATERIAVFGEYKHNLGNFEFGDEGFQGDGFQGNYSTNMLLGGIAYHFR